MLPDLPFPNLRDQGLGDAVLCGDRHASQWARENVTDSRLSEAGVPVALSASQDFGTGTGMMLVACRPPFRVDTTPGAIPSGEQTDSGSMSTVFKRRRPLKVGDEVVGLDAVDVVDVVCADASVQERLCNKSVHLEEPQRSVATSAQANTKIPIMSQGWFQDASGPRTGPLRLSSDTSGIGHGVPAFVTDNRSPNLHTDSVLQMEITRKGSH